MPGIIVFQRRWSVGSDDLFVPASFLVVFHMIWLIVLSVSLDQSLETTINSRFNDSDTAIQEIGKASNQITLSTESDGISNPCKINIFRLHVAFLILWSVALLIEVAIICVSLRGTILEDYRRWPAEYLLYVKLVLWILEIAFTICGVIWTYKNYISCSISNTTKSVIIGLVISNGVIFVTALMTIWCSYDVAGRYWVRLKQYKISQSSKKIHNTKILGSEFSIQQTHASSFNSNIDEGKPDVPSLLQNTSSERIIQGHPRAIGRRACEGNPNRSWKHRKVRLAYQNSWDTRCQHIFCCVKISKNRKAENSFSDIARVLSEFFRDLDVVPGDVVVGLVLLRQRQQLLRLRVIHQPTNSVYKFLSGVRVTPNTPFLLPSSSTSYHHHRQDQPSIAQTTHNVTIPHSNGERTCSPISRDEYDNDTQMVSHAYRFMHFAMGIYGWPMYLRQNKSGMATCRLCSSLSCCKMGHNSSSSSPISSEVDNGTFPAVNDDNCCSCNYAAYSQVMRQIDPGNTKLVYVTYHVDVGETPFLIAVDYAMSAIVVSIRGTLSLTDILTDLNAEGEPLPIRPVNEEWMGHKGMVDAAQYIYRKLKEEHLLTRAFNSDKDRGTQSFGLVCVGHSLGAGTATILAIMLRQEYPKTQCFAYSPPGGTLSQSAVEYSKDFVTSIVVGKDVVPRIGLHQMETLRHDLMNALTKSKDSKWKTLLSKMACCVVPSIWELTAEEVEAKLGIEQSREEVKRTTASAVLQETIDKPSEHQIEKGEKEKCRANNDIESKLCKANEVCEKDEINIHPLDSTIHLSVHQKLLPPGRIIHIVRHYPRNTTKKKPEPTYKAIWAENNSFDEVLISKKMVQDHMPDTVLEVLGKLLEQMGEDSNVSTLKQPNLSTLDTSNITEEAIPQETLKGTFTASRKEKTLVNSGVQNDDVLVRTSTLPQARQL